MNSITQINSPHNLQLSYIIYITMATCIVIVHTGTTTSMSFFKNISPVNQTVITLINTIKILLSSSCRIPGTDFKSSVFCTYLARLHISTIQSIGKTKSLPNILYPISLAVILSLSSSSACFRDAERSLLTVLTADLVSLYKVIYHITFNRTSTFNFTRPFAHTNYMYHSFVPSVISTDSVKLCSCIFSFKRSLLYGFEIQ